MPDLLRRVAVLTFLSAVGIALLAPLSARSAVPGAAIAAAPLLDALATSRGDLARGSLADRAATSRLAVAVEAHPPGAETLVPTAFPSRAVAPMQATLLPIATPRLAVLDAGVASDEPGNTVTGTATWYCCSLGYRGLAVVALSGALGGQYDPPPAAREVTVCADRCAVLPVVDYCDCLWGTASERVADLSPEAWAAITDVDPSAGLVTVTVHLDG